MQSDAKLTFTIKSGRDCHMIQPICPMKHLIWDFSSSVIGALTSQRLAGENNM